jgi:hypothetical protein
MFFSRFLPQLLFPVLSFRTLLGFAAAWTWTRGILPPPYAHQAKKRGRSAISPGTSIRLALALVPVPKLSQASGASGFHMSKIR